MTLGRLIAKRRLIGILWLATILAFGVWGCGQVITRPTPEPTATVALLQRATPRPTATPAPYTPEPTPTPTLTPTPIIYVVQRGDNLLRIAGLYGVSVEALQEINGITDPRLLRIGQTLIIPPEEGDETALAGPTATPTPMPVEISQLTFNHAPTGEWWVLGEVYNPNAEPLEQVVVQVVLLDDEEQEIGRGEAFVELDLVEPGGKVPFALQIAASQPAFASYQAMAISAVPAYVGSYYRDLEVRDVTAESERYATYRLTGRVVNVGPEEAVAVNVVATLYDAVGRVIGVRRDIPEHNVIPRGGETAFRLDIIPVGGPAADYAVVAQGRRLPTPTP